ncbi:MAG: RnfABCDGE type electron transport complex subunit D [Pseudomonadota bacterium]
MSIQAILSGPHTHSKFSVTETMIAVMVCLSPATAMGFYLFGWPAVFLFAVTIASALAAEAFCLVLARKSVMMHVTDGSAMLTGWLIAMTLPPWAPWWVGAVGAVIAIVVAKHVYGGLGQNLFNPAMVARAILLVAFPVQMTSWVMPHAIGDPLSPNVPEALAITFGRGPSVDALSGATTLSQVTAELSGGRTVPEVMAETFDLTSLAWGQVSGSLGETSALLLLLGGVMLLAMRLISWHIPVAVLGSVALLSGALHWVDPLSYPSPLWHLSSGALVLCAFFIATDYVTSPVSRMGKLIYGCGIGVLIVIIRTFGAFPEGAAFAVLLMNGCAPIIDEFTRPRIFGRTRKGAPMPLPKDTSHG